MHFLARIHLLSLPLLFLTAGAPLFLLSSPAASSDDSLVMWYDKPADGYGLKSPLKCWEVESPDRTNKRNPD